jgi:hypothetical protein
MPRRLCVRCGMPKPLATRGVWQHQLPCNARTSWHRAPHHSPALHIFFDTEFTQFRDGRLLSIGLVADDDRQHYVEILDPVRHAAASDFCKTDVLNQFGLYPGCGVATDAEAGARIAAWLASFDAPLVLCYDYKLDWRFLEASLCAAGAWPSIGPRLTALNVADVAHDPSCLAARDAYFNTHTQPGRHHALLDALALRARWRQYLQLVDDAQLPT